jgi:hypothetical protein
LLGLALTLLFNILGFFLGMMFLFLMSCVFLGSLGWVYRDAKARGKPGFAAALLVAVAGWPLSLLAWYVFRPEKKINQRSAILENIPMATPPVIAEIR